MRAVSRELSMNRKLLSVLALVASLYTLSAIAPPCAVAANRRIVISASDLSTKSVTITIGKKSSVRSVTCYKGVGGKASRVKKTYSFTPYSSLLRSAKANGAKRSVIELYAALKAASVNACKLDIPNLPTPAPTPTPKPTPTPVQNTTPDFLSMSPYTGPFGEDQARTLFDRFAYGAPPERIAQAVADGLAVTIQKLTNYTPEPDLDADEASMRCTRLPRGDSRIGTTDFKCNPLDPNDIRMDGVRGALLYRHVATQNPFFDRLEFFIRDRFQSVNSNVINDGRRTWSVIPYINVVRKAAQQGDYVQYLRDFGNDYMGAMVWLHLLNSSAVRPNEDEAREILQLGGTGPFNLDGTPVYGDLDVAQVALALTGQVENDYVDANGFHRYVPAFSAIRHAAGPERVFIGTPYEAQIRDLNSVVDAIKNHPRLAENIAENIYDDFINPFATPDAIRSLAAVVRSSNYNVVTVMRTVMASQALYASKSQKSIPKQPLEFIVGFLRTTGIPYLGDYYDDFQYLASIIGQVDLAPITVFGWRNRDSLAGQGYILARRRVLANILGQNLGDLLSQKQFTYWDRFLQNLNTGGAPSLQYVRRLATWLHVPLNAAQEASIVQYLDYDEYECNQNTGCPAGQKYYLYRRPFDPSIDNSYDGKYGTILSGVRLLPRGD